jgi:hypothetical protein
MCPAPPFVQESGRANGQDEGVYFIMGHINGCGPERRVHLRECTQKGKS